MGLIAKGIDGKKRGANGAVANKSIWPFRGVLRGVEGGSGSGVGLGIDWGHRGF